MTDSPAGLSWIHAPLEASPDEVGFDATRLDRLEEIFERLVSEGKVQAAAFCLARHGRVFADQALGPRHPAGGAPMQPTTWRGMASVTKVLTAIGVLKLVEDGRILMEWPVAKVLPEFDTPELRNLRLEHLLTHTSGLMPDPGSDGEAAPDFQAAWTLLQREDWLHALAARPVHGTPGQTWRYSSAGFAVIGEMIARTVGEPYALWMEREILRPAGLHETFFDPGSRPLDQFAWVSDFERSMIEGRSSCLHHSRLALGHAWSTCRDMNRLARLLAEDGSLDGVRILGRRTVEAMRRVHVNVSAPHWGDNFPDWRYGLGLELARHPLVQPGMVWGHEGASRCAMWFDVGSGITMAWTLPTSLDWDPDFGWTPRAVVLSGLI